MSKLTIGALELGELPNLDITSLQVRIDTGAKTSSLHVDNVSHYNKAGKPWVKFDIHPDVYDVNTVKTCHSKVEDTRKIKSSNGTSEQRCVIKTIFKIGERQWPIELTLTDRSDMNYPMLLGRQGMGDRVLVDPSKTFMSSTDEGSKEGG